MVLLTSLAYFSKTKITAIYLAYAFFLQVVHCKSPDGKRYFSSSIVGMEVLLKTERELLNTLANYTSLLERKLAVIRGAIAEMRAENQKSKKNPEEYLSNPINSYALIRRLHEDWISWQLFLQSSVGTDEINRIEILRGDNPTSKDLSETTEAIYRIQRTYELNPADMAVGILYGKQYDARFSAMDCYSIGRELFSKDYYNLSGIWLKTSLHLFQDSYINEVHGFDKTKIFEAYAQALLKQGRFADALKAINDAIHLSPRKANLLRAKSEIEFQKQTAPETAEEKVKSGKYWEIVNERECLNENVSHLSKLHCFYNRTASAFLYLAPFKMEVLHLDPYVILYHDVISDSETGSLREFAGSRLERSSVHYPSENQDIISSARNAKSTWFPGDTNDVTLRLKQRIADFTGFDLSESEDLQVANYGLGGNFVLHHDHFGGPLELSSPGDRISTVLIYMSDVEHGGATVFPRINITIYPKKGSALVWYNLNTDGKGNERTMHVGCPVIVGSKWNLSSEIQLICKQSVYNTDWRRCVLLKKHYSYILYTFVKLKIFLL